MSDTRLRTLERRWQETGSNEDGAAFVLECARVGEAEALLRALAKHDPRLLWRVALALAEAVLPAWEQIHGSETAMDLVAKAIRAQIQDPELEIRWETVSSWVTSRHQWACQVSGAEAADSQAAQTLAKVAGSQPSNERESAEGLSQAWTTAVAAAGEASVRSRVLAELGPLLSSDRDPLADRAPDLSLSEFWQLVAASKKADDGGDGQSDALLELLRTRSFAEIVDFRLHFDTLYLRASRYELWSAAALIDGGCSDDGFMDFRYGLIAQGEAIFEAALSNPDSLVTVDDFIPNEGFGYVGRQALEEKIGNPTATLLDWALDWLPSSRYGERGAFIEPELLPELFPKLWAKYGERT